MIIIRNFRGLLLALICASIAITSAPARAFDACNAQDIANYQPIAEREKLADLGIFYKVVKCGVAPSHLLGTIHSDAPAIIKAIAPAKAEMLNSDQAIFEYVEPANIIAASQALLLPQGQSLRTIIGEQRFIQLATALANHSGVTTDVADQFKPWAAASLLHYPPAISDGVILDIALQRAAKKLEIALAGLESFDEQIALFDTLPQALQLTFVDDTLRMLPQIPQLHRQLIDAYKNNDLSQIQQIASNSVSQETPAALQQFMQQQVIIKRNQKMAKRAAPYLSKGNAFIAVGALHLPEPSGLLQAFERSGYYLIGLPIFLQDNLAK